MSEDLAQGAPQVRGRGTGDSERAHMLTQPLLGAGAHTPRSLACLFLMWDQVGPTHGPGHSLPRPLTAGRGSPRRRQGSGPTSAARPGTFLGPLCHTSLWALTVPGGAQ